MRLRSPVMRRVAFAWATLQLVASALTSVAHAQAGIDAVAPVAHVEATTGEKCPVVHPPECGVCRHLSDDARPAAPAPIPGAAPRTSRCGARDLAHRASAIGALPRGRSPPLT